MVDTGIHRFGWTKENAVKFITANTAYSTAAAEFEVDRYISMPGHATCYKIGEREIHRLRKKFTIELDFDLKKFHTAVLNCEGPIDILESCVSIRIYRVIYITQGFQTIMAFHICAIFG